MRLKSTPKDYFGHGFGVSFGVEPEGVVEKSIGDNSTLAERKNHAI
jgi:hypothetical protein